MEEEEEVVTYYWENKVLKALYAKATPDSDETIIDILWNNTLQLYFPLDKGYSIEPQVHPMDQNPRKCNLVVGSYQTSRLRKMIIIEDKRREYENQASVWEEAEDQVLRELKVSRMDWPRGPDHSLYAMVNVGLYSRFYTLEKHEHQFSFFKEAGDKYYHYKEDHVRIHKILKKLAKATTPTP